MKKRLISGAAITILLLLGTSLLVEATTPWMKSAPAISDTAIADETNSSDAALSQLVNNTKTSFHGVWGYNESNDTAGIIAGTLVKHQRGVVLKGRWTTTDNTTQGRVVGVLRNGYFCGRLLMGNSTYYRITGLFRYDSDSKILSLRWMTKANIGWAHCQILQS